MVVVAGAGGFLGGHLVSWLVRAGCRRVRAVDRKPLERWSQVTDGVENRVVDLASTEACARVCAGARSVFQLAADDGGVGYASARGSASMLSALVDAQLLTAACDAGVERFLLASSPRDDVRWRYAEELCRRIGTESAMATRVARIHGVIGPLAPWLGGRERVAAALCRKAVEAKLSDEPWIEVWGTGAQRRSFLCVDDCIDGLLRVSASDVVEPVELGGGGSVAVDALVDAIEEIAGLRLERRYLPTAPTGVAERACDERRLLEQLGWSPSAPIRDALARTYKWVHDEYLRRFGGRLGPRPPTPVAPSPG